MASDRPPGRGAGRAPFDWLPAGSGLPAALSLTVLLLVSSIALLVSGEPLRTDAAPGGIIDFEFAGTAARAAEILGSWPPAARERAMFSLGLDYLYLLVYPAWFALLCGALARRLAERLPPVVGRAGLLAAWAVLAAAPLDALENYGLLRILIDGASGPAAESWARVAWVCAAPKFAVVGIAALYLLLGAPLLLLRRRSPS